MTEPKLCKDCKHFKTNKLKSFFFKFAYFYECHRSPVTFDVSQDLITGKVSKSKFHWVFDCEDQRLSDAYHCGPEGEYFEKREDYD